MILKMPLVARFGRDLKQNMLCFNVFSLVGRRNTLFLTWYLWPGEQLASNRGAVHDVQSDGGDCQEGEGEAAGQEEDVPEQ